MSTTAVFVELLIVGIQACAWVTLLIAGICGVACLDWIVTQTAQLGTTASSVVLLSIAYTLGTLVDRLADSPFFFQAPRRFLNRWPFVDRWTKKHTPSYRLCIFAAEKQLTAYVNYLKSRHRVLRATTLNCALMTLAAVSLVLRQSHGWNIVPRCGAVCITLAVGVALFAIAFVAWGLMDAVCHQRIEEDCREAVDRVRQNEKSPGG